MRELKGWNEKGDDKRSRDERRMLDVDSYTL
jgi:hypothetical protein